jgi:hypothetical protein
MATITPLKNKAMKEILTTSGTALKDQNKESLPTIKSN